MGTVRAARLSVQIVRETVRGASDASQQAVRNLFRIEALPCVLACHHGLLVRRGRIMRMNTFMTSVVVVLIGLLALLPILRRQGGDSSSYRAKRLWLIVALVVAAAVLAAYGIFPGR